jgi:hypothetical protein
VTVGVEKMDSETEFLEEYKQLCSKYNLRLGIYDEDSLYVAPLNENYEEAILTSVVIEERLRLRKEAEIREHKEYYDRIGVPTDEEGKPLVFEGPILPPPNYSLIEWNRGSNWVALDWPYDRPQSFVKTNQY